MKATSKCDTCKKRHYDRTIVGSPCYFCKHNSKDNRIDWYEEDETLFRKTGEKPKCS